VSNDGANSSADRIGREVITVVPVTSNAARVLLFPVLLPSSESRLHRDSKAQAEQIRLIAMGHVGERVGALPTLLHSAHDEAIRLHLAL
jgi:mRNA interferase MazF